MAEKRGGDFGASFVASGDLSGAQFKCVGFSGNDCFLPVSGAMAGILQNKPKNDEHASVVMLGFSKVWAGVAFTSGDAFMTGSGGYAIAVTSGGYALGHMLTTVVSGEIGEALVHPYKTGVTP